MKSKSTINEEMIYTGMPECKEDMTLSSLNKIKTLNILTSEKRNPPIIKNYTTSMDAETFFFGDCNVMITNPNSYFNEKCLVDEKELAHFLQQNLEQYKRTFDELATATREFMLEQKKEKDMSYQLSCVKKVLDTVPIKELIKETSISACYLSELKHGKRSLNSMSVKKFKELYSVREKMVILSE